jgi:hypothetical protein
MKHNNSQTNEMGNNKLHKDIHKPEHIVSEAYFMQLTERLKAIPESQAKTNFFLTRKATWAYAGMVAAATLLAFWLFNPEQDHFTPHWTDFEELNELVIHEYFLLETPEADWALETPEAWEWEYLNLFETH